MKMWKGFAIVGCLLAPLVARGHIGDNMAQLRQAYGATGKVAANTIIFQRNGYSICVYFDGDRSAMEIFTRDGSDKAHTTISPADIEGILKLEGEGQGWSQMVGTKTGNQVWLRADRKLIAHLSPGDTPQEAVFVVMENKR